MDRHEAYALLTRILRLYQDKPFAELEALTTADPRVERLSKNLQEFIVEIRVAWSTDGAAALVVSATADSPGTKLERIEESVVVARPSGT